MSSTSRTRHLLLGVLVTALVLLCGCNAGQPAGMGGQTGATDGSSAAAGDGSVTSGIGGAPAASAPAQPKPSQPVQPAPTFPTAARAYAEAAVAAWSTHSLTRLSELATPGVYQQFIEIPGNLKTDWIYYRCDGVAGSNYCTLRNGDGDSVTLRVTTQYLGKPHAVVELSANLTTYPANGEAYASEFVRAWAAGNTPRMRALAKPDVVVAVNDNHQDRPTGNWTLSTVSEHGGAGLLIVDVAVNEGSIKFTLDVGTTLLGTRHAIIGYRP